MEHCWDRNSNVNDIYQKDPDCLQAWLIGGIAALFCAALVFALFYDVRQWFKSKYGSASIAIRDQYTTTAQVEAALRKAGLESSSLIVGIDFTKSNTWNGERSFYGRCLHEIDPKGQWRNPYQQAIAAVGEVMERFDDDKLIPAFGFGDEVAKDMSVFSLTADGEPCKGFKEVLDCYHLCSFNVTLKGPTSFAPLIRRAVEIVRQTGEYHILVIIADGQVDNEVETEAAIVEASSHPLSILMIGVGDGPWDQMDKYDDELPKRKFDNFQFVNFTKLSADMDMINANTVHRQAVLAIMCLQEIPEQYKAIKKLGLLKHAQRGEAHAPPRRNYEHVEGYASAPGTQ